MAESYVIFFLAPSEVLMSYTRCRGHGWNWNTRPPARGEVRRSRYILLTKAVSLVVCARVRREVSGRIRRIRGPIESKRWPWRNSRHRCCYCWLLLELVIQLRVIFFYAKLKVACRWVEISEPMAGRQGGVLKTRCSECRRDRARHLPGCKCNCLALANSSIFFSSLLDSY
jgi:hypothetical protein